MGLDEVPVTVTGTPLAAACDAVLPAEPLIIVNKPTALPPMPRAGIDLHAQLEVQCSRRRYRTVADCLANGGHCGVDVGCADTVFGDLELQPQCLDVGDVAGIADGCACNSLQLRTEVEAGEARVGKLDRASDGQGIERADDIQAGRQRTSLQH